MIFKMNMKNAIRYDYSSVKIALQNAFDNGKMNIYVFGN